MHIHAILNTGATRKEVAEVIFQMATYGGMLCVIKGKDDQEGDAFFLSGVLDGSLGWFCRQGWRRVVALTAA